MKILAIDSSAKSASAAVVDNGILKSEFFVNNGLTHSQTLIPMIKNVLDMSGCTVSEIDTFAVSNGPGSFTGVRIGVASIKGMALNKPCIGVSTLLSMAYNLVNVYDGLICCAMDARRNQVYTALFECHRGKISRLTEDSALSLSDLHKSIENSKKIPIFIGDGAKICYNYFIDKETDCFIAPESLLMQRASGVAYACLSDECKRVSASELRVNYLRLSQAEREMKERLLKQN